MLHSPELTDMLVLVTGLEGARSKTKGSSHLEVDAEVTETLDADAVSWFM
jgi:hypothetical protein